MLTYKNLLLTLWTRSLIAMPGVDAGVSAISIPYPTFKPFFAALWTTKGGRRFIGDEKKTSFLKWVAKASNQTSDELSEQLGPVFEALFNEIEAVSGEVQPLRSLFDGGAESCQEPDEAAVQPDRLVGVHDVPRPVEARVAPAVNAVEPVT